MKQEVKWVTIFSTHEQDEVQYWGQEDEKNLDFIDIIGEIKRGKKQKERFSWVSNYALKNLKQC